MQPEATIVVIISANGEWQAVRSMFPALSSLPSPYGEWSPIPREMLSVPAGHQIIFFHGGWGKIAAAGSTQYAIDRWHPKLLINLGTCGGFAGYIQRGDIILVNQTIVYDILEQMGDYAAHIRHYSTELDLSWLRQPYPHPVVCTRLVSGDRDLLPEQVPMLHQSYAAIAGDWESGAIAWVARRNGVRLLILRGVTDLVGPDGSEAYGNLTFFEHAARQIMERLIQALPAWLECSLD